ncbi:MAG: DNA polymerase/3'-5' exonuclease PolX [Syntrophorhabdaceae bacterium]|nr:DNA polymerase/3'-5' exonuclease PolX [Syntrophorhabdaceae bacterium]
MPAGNIVTILEKIGMLLEIKGENPFKSRAYLNAAQTVSKNVEDLDRIVSEGRLREIKGIGEAIAARITEYMVTGKIDYYEELKSEVPESLLELTGVPNLGPKKIKVLFEELHITNVGQLEYACRENRLVNLPGFGEKTQEKILKGVEFIKRHKGEHLFGDVYPDAAAIRDRLRGLVSSGLVEVCGSIRRRKEVVKDMDILAAGDDREAISLAFTTLPGIEEIYLAGETKTSCRLISGVDADLRVVSFAEYPCALLYFTGSKEHNVHLRGIAKKRGLKLNEYGLFDGDRPIAVSSEKDVYQALGLAYIPPEMREDMGEIEAAQSGMLPELVEESDVRGVFHIHTDFSDGSDSVENMVEAARKLGFCYLGISDHSKSAYYAGGLKKDDLFRQWEHIDGLNEKWEDIHIFKGIESDILPDGSLDYDDDILRHFDFVIASIHSNFNLKGDEQITRVITAMDNPWMTMLGHPTGRLLLSREGYGIDMKTVIDEAAKRHVIIELNASPYRFDIDWRHLPYARSKGVMISINPDAHSTAGLSEVFYGVGIARKGWQEKKDILNTRTREEVEKVFQNRRRR